MRDISRSTIEEFSGNSSSNRLLKLVLTDGLTDITAIEYSHIPSIPNDVVPGTKVSSFLLSFLFFLFILNYLFLTFYSCGGVATTL